MAQQQPQVAGSGQPDQALRLVPRPSTGSRYFWVTLGSLYAGSTMLQQEAVKNFKQAQEDGVLLFAWYGSSALKVTA